MRGIDLNKSLEQIENDFSGDADSDATNMVSECHRLRRVPLSQLKPGDLRLLIGQDISLQRLVPLALALVESDPFIEGSYYPGDLLIALLRSESSFWQRHPEYRCRLLSAAANAVDEARAGGSERLDFNDTELLLSYQPSELPKPLSCLQRQSRRTDLSLSCSPRKETATLSLHPTASSNRRRTNDSNIRNATSTRFLQSTKDPTYEEYVPCTP